MFKRLINVVQLSCLIMVLLTGTVHATSITNIINFNSTQSGSGSGSFSFPGLNGSFSPFNSSLGTLESFYIGWEASIATSGTTASNGGGFNHNIGGHIFINDRSYYGTGNGASTGSGYANSRISALSPVSFGNTFLVSDAGRTYDPYYLSTVTGLSSFNLGYGHALGELASVSFGGMADITSILTGSVTLIYNYTSDAAPVPEPSTILLFGGGLAALFIYCKRRRGNISEAA